jgi:ABC-2 type transport system permease protein
MGHVLTIARREVTSLFVSPVAYLVLFLFLVFMGIVFVWRIFLPGQLVEIRNLIDLSRFALFFVVPLMTMSLMSDEYRSGRIEILRTSPITEMELVLGKFLGAMTFYLFLVGSTVIYLVILWLFGKPDVGQVISSYIGMIFMGVMFVSVGLFFSACTSEQIVAALASIITLGLLVILYPYLSSGLPSALTIPWVHLDLPIRHFADYVGVGSHIENFSRGALEITDIVYFCGFSALFLFFTYLVLESKKWR